MRTAAKAIGLGVLLVAGAASLAGCKGKGAGGGCGMLGDCGGNPLGEWKISGICNFPVAARPAQNYANTTPYYQPETGAPAPAVTSGSWCWDLQFDKDGTLISPAVPMPKPDVVVGGRILFNEDQTYIYELTAKSTTAVHLARSCFGVNGADLTCAELAKKMETSTIGVNPVYTNDSGGTKPAFTCLEKGDGCDCTFDYIETDQNAVGDKGRWVVDGNVIHHYSISGQGILFETHPARRTARDATFCVSDDGNTLELSGTNGQPLALKVGLRSLTLKRVVPPPDAGASPPEAGVEAAPEAPADAAEEASDADDASSDTSSDASSDANADASDAD
jgi:hypothetical protein